MRAAASARIDQAAGLVRLNYITVAPGQELVYAEKQKEAEAFLADTSRPGAEFPHLAQEAELNGITLFEQAVEYVTMARQWAQVSALIETRRLEAKQRIAAATAPAEIEAVGFDFMIDH